MNRHVHYWLKTDVPRWDVFVSHKFRYDCSVCGKQKFFKQQPMNPIVPSSWEVYKTEIRNGNTHLVMKPPMLLGEEQLWVEGERYKELLAVFENTEKL